MATTTLIEELYKEKLAVRDILKEYEDDWDLVDELMHDVYAAALESEYDGKSEPLTWLCGIAKNIGRMHVRSVQTEKRQGEVPECYLEPDVDDEGYATPYYDRMDLSSEAAVQAEHLDPYYEVEAEQTLADALDRMPDRMADVVMRRRAGLSNPLIAKQLGVSEKTVRNLVHESSKYFRDNSLSNATNSVSSERDAKPVDRFASQADVERAVRERFARRDSALRMRRLRIENPDLTPAEWKELY